MGNGIEDNPVDEKKWTVPSLRTKFAAIDFFDVVESGRPAKCCTCGKTLIPIPSSSPRQP